MENLTELLEEKYDSWKLIEFELRAFLVENIIEDYIERNGRRPPNKALNILTDLYLFDHLEGDARKDKKKEEYSILSQSQYDRRVKGKSQNRNSYGVVFKEVGFDDISVLSSDGVDYRIPKRRYD